MEAGGVEGEGEGEQEEGQEIEEGEEPARSDEERLAAARRAWEREQASGRVITVDHVHTGRSLEVVQRHRSYRKEGASSFAAWTKQHMNIGRFMARLYVKAGAVTLRAVRRCALSVEKLALLSEVPPGLQPELARLCERLSRQRSRVVIKAATASLARSPDQRAALAVALAAVEQQGADAVCAAPEVRADAVVDAGVSVDAVESARVRACECVLALQRDLVALQGQVQRGAQVAAPLARIDAQQQQLGEALDALRAAHGGLSRLNISGEKESDLERIEDRGAQQTGEREEGDAQDREGDDGEADDAQSSEEGGGLDDGEDEAPDDEEEQTPTAGAPAPVRVTTEELARALCAGLSEAEQERLSNAFLGVLSRHNEPWARRSRRFLTMAVQQAQRCGQMLSVVGTAFLEMLDGSAAHFKTVFGTFLELSALPSFRKDLDLLCQGDLSPEERAQVQAQAAKLPRFPPITDAVAHRAAIWNAHDELVARLPPPEL